MFFRKLFRLFQPKATDIGPSEESRRFARANGLPPYEVFELHRDGRLVILHMNTDNDAAGA